MKFSQALRFLTIVSLPFSASAQAAQPWDEQRTRQETLQDPAQFDRPVTNTLKGGDIKEFRDKLNALKAQIFKEGNVPGGAAFRSEVNDPSALGAVVKAEARFDQFTEPLQAQIAAQLPDAARSQQRILVEIPTGAGSDALKVSSAKFTDSKTTLVKSPDPLDAPSSIVPPVIVPARVPIERPQPASLRQPASSRTNEPKANEIRDPVLDSGSRSPMAPLAGMTAKPLIAKPEKFKPYISDVARTFSGGKGQMREESRTMTVASKIQAVAVLPLQGGGELLVESVTQALSADVQLGVRANSSQLPDALESQIEADLPGTLKKVEANQDIRLVIALKPDNTLRVESVNTAISRAPEVQAPSVQPAETAPSAGFRSQEPGVVLMRARELGQTLGIQAESVTIERRELKTEAEPRTVSAAVFTLEQGGTVVVQEAPAGDDQTPRYTAEAKFRDLSPEIKAKVAERLVNFGGDKALADTSQVVVEVQMNGPQAYDVTAITLKNPTAPEDQKQITLWKEEEVLEEVRHSEGESEAAEISNPVLDPGSRPPAADLSGMTKTPAIPPAVPLVVSRPVSRGLAPVVSRVATEALGFEKGNFEMRDPDPQGKLRVQSVNGPQRTMPVSFRRPPRGGAYEFSVQGRPLEFSDSIREQIYAQLKAAVENGDIWARAAVDGLKDLVVEFEVPDEGVAPAEKLRLKSVSATSKDTAQQAAQDMGLASGDYLIVNAGAQTLLVLEKNVSARLKSGDKELKLSSPDGDAKIFIKAERAKADQSLVLMLSKKSLKANRDSMAKTFGGAAAKAVDAALEQHPQEEQFIVRLDPAAGEVALIKPVSELQPNNSIMNKP